MIRSDSLPDFVFVAADGSGQTLRLSAETARIRAIAARVAEAVPPGAPVGLMYPSGPELVLAWLGCVLAGAQPLVMQYPTRKQTRLYWEASISHAVDATGLALALCDRASAEAGLGRFVRVLELSSKGLPAEAPGPQAASPAGPQAPSPAGPQAAFPAEPPAVSAAMPADAPDGRQAGGGAADTFEVADFAILQMSSGTTGHRKAMRFSAADLHRHAHDFNQVLGLSQADRIVSWLPLYHDMGYLACFVMPLLLGVSVVMMDPVAWVQTPALLTDAIARHAGTVCYMPNFGFEVMAREPARATPSMRLWVSCSEPVSPATARRFVAHLGLQPAQFAACYAMAENVFAVSLARGITTRVVDGTEVISCGAPIPGVEVKCVDGELWVRSPTGIAGYLNGPDISDADGFYPTGDLGELHDGALYVTGRRGDLLIQAGRKFMLSDIDLALNRLYPEVRGRAAALARTDAKLGTQVAVVLIEAADFFTRTDQDAIAEALRAEIGLDQIEVAFVPPRFLTKTSSGKINRKLSGAHWQAVLDQRGAMPGATDPVAELRAAFPRLPRDSAVGEALDSLSLTVLRLILAGAGVAYDPAQTLAGLEAALAEAAPAAATAEAGLRIVSLADRHTIALTAEHHLDTLAARLGCRVTLEHVCLPPSPVLLSDLIFADYFAPRLDPAATVALQSALARLRGASVVLTDDVAELRIPPNQAYGVLSHNLERDPRSDLIAVRWQSYPRLHHMLPTSFVSGRDLPLEDRALTLRQLAQYLGKPLFRIATFPGLSTYTEGWEYRTLPDVAETPNQPGLVDPGRMLAALADWMAALPSPPERVSLTAGPALEMNDLGHFCSHFAHQAHVDRILAAHDSFCLAGQDSSLAYVDRVLSASGKRFVRVPSYAPEILSSADSFDCLLLCGAWGEAPAGVKAASLMFPFHGAPSTFNIDDPEQTALVFKRNSRHDPPSGTDWFHSFTLNRDWKLDVWAEDRKAGAGARAPQPQASAEDLLALGKAARADGELAEARALAERAVAERPRRASGYRLLAAVASDMDDTALLEDVLRRARAHLAPADETLAAIAERLERRQRAQRRPVRVRQ